MYINVNSDIPYKHDDGEYNDDGDDSNYEHDDVDGADHAEHGGEPEA